MQSQTAAQQTEVETTLDAAHERTIRKRAL